MSIFSSSRNYDHCLQILDGLVVWKMYQTWDFFGRNDAKAETPVFWPPHVKSWLIGKDSDASRDWGQEKGMTEDEMAGWHHWLDGRESAWTPGVGDGQGGLACCDSWGLEESDTTELNWTELNGVLKLWVVSAGMSSQQGRIQYCSCWFHFIFHSVLRSLKLGSHFFLIHYCASSA